MIDSGHEPLPSLILDDRAALDLLDSVPRVASAIFGAVSSSILLLDTERDQLIFQSVSNRAEEDLVGKCFPREVGIAGWVVGSGEAIVVDDVAHLAHFAKDVAEATGHVPDSIMAAPLIHDGQTLGVLEVVDPSPQARTNLNELELLSMFAEQAAISLHAVIQHRQAQLNSVLPVAASLSDFTASDRQVALRTVRLMEELLANSGHE